MQANDIEIVTAQVAGRLVQVVRDSHSKRVLGYVLAREANRVRKYANQLKRESVNMGNKQSTERTAEDVRSAEESVRDYVGRLVLLGIRTEQTQNAANAAVDQAADDEDRRREILRRPGAEPPGTWTDRLHKARKPASSVKI